MDAVLAARYPFTSLAQGYLQETAPTLEELLGDRVFAGTRGRGRERAIAAVRDGEVPAPTLAASTPPRDLLEETLSYGYARILVSALDDTYVVRRYAMAESKRVTHYLDAESPEHVGAIAREFGMEAASVDEDQFRLHFTDYLKHAVHLKDTSYKLVNQPMERGFVRVSQHVLARLVEEAFRRRTEAELPLPVPDEVAKRLEADLEALRVAAQERKSQLAPTEFGAVDLDAMPPCLKHILAMLQRGENAPHTARFAITSFLHVIGMDTEEIMRLFSTAPDFREDLTRYQVEHITGKTSGTQYTPPGCQAMKTYGICYNEDDWCRRTNKEGERYVSHPLSYYRWALKRKAWAKQQQPAREGPATPPPEA